MKMLGIDAQAVTSGPRKDMVSPFKPLEPEEIAILQDMVDEFHNRFVAVVSAGRPKLAETRVRELADGRVYTGEQALELGLVDAIGYIEDAIAAAKKAAGVQRVRVVMYHRPFGHRPNAYAAPSAPSPEALQVSLIHIDAGIPSLLDWSRPRIMYLWTGRAVAP
jgi:protease-4